MEAVIGSKILDHGSGNRHHPILVSFAVADPEFVFVAPDVVNGEIETFRESKPAAIDELDRGSVTTQPDVLQKIVNLLTR